MIIKQQYKICTILFLLLFSFKAFIYSQNSGQKTVYDDKKCFVKDIEESKINTLKRSAKILFDKYQELASVKDPTSGGFVTRNSVQKFKELFEEEAKVTCDVTFNPYKLPYEDYASMAFDYLTNSGIRFSIDKADFLKLYEKDGYYYGEIEFLKRMYFSLDNQFKISNCKKGRVFKETLVLRWTVFDLVNPKIDAINGGLISECSDSNPAWSWGIEAGALLPQIQGSDQLGSQLNIDAKTSITGSISVAYYKSLGTNGKTWLKLGLNGGIIQSSFSILPSSYTQKNTSDIFGASNATKFASFDRIVHVRKEIIEKQTNLLFSIPLGLRKQLWAANENKFNFGIELGATVSAMMGMQKAWFGQLAYQGVYHYSDGSQTVIPNVNSDIFTDAYGLKSNVFFDPSDKDSESTGTSVAIPSQYKVTFSPIIEAFVTPYLNFKMSEKSFVHIGFYGNYAFTNFFKSNNSEKFVFSGEPTQDGSVQDRINQGLNTNLMEDLTKSYKGVRVGIQIALFKFIK